MARTPAPGTRKRILDTASRLFGTHGVRAVGMQQMMDESGMGKSLLYREFPSKDDLVTAWLKATDEEWWAQAEEAIRVHEGDPARQLLAMVEFVRDGALIAEFHGCVFYNTCPGSACGWSNSAWPRAPARTRPRNWPTR